MKELRRICCEETDRARQARIEEYLSLHQERNPTTVGQLLTQIQGFQNKVKSLFLRSWNSEQLWSDPCSQSTLYIPSQDHALPRFWIAARHTEYCGYFQERFLNDYLLEKEKPLLSSTMPRIWRPLVKNWDLILNEMQKGRRVKWDENCEVLRYLYHASRLEVDC